MKILVLYAHPVETSFKAGLHRTIVERLTRERFMAKVAASMDAF